MTVREYLGGLERGLRGMDEGEREDFLREMESHIADLRERRPEEPEEAIVAGLTPPESLAAELLGAEAGEGARREGAHGRLDAEPSSGRRAAGSREGGGGRGVGERLREALGLLEGLGGIRLRLGEGEGEFSRELPGEGLSSILALLFSGEIRARPSLDGRLRFRAEGAESEGRLRVESAQGRLELVEVEDGGEPIEELELEVPEGIEVLRLESRSGDIDIEGLGCALLAKTRSGDIGARECAGSVGAESASGDVLLEGCGPASVTTASGDIGVEGSSGDVVAKSASGSVSIAGVEGSAAAETANGDIELSGVEGRLAAKTASGEVSVVESPGPAAVSSVSGGVELDFAEGFSGCAVATVSGDVTIGLPDPPDAAVRASSRSGEVSVGGEAGRRLELLLGGGGPELSVQTVSGDISVDW